MDEASRQDCQSYFDAESRTWSDRYGQARSFQVRLETIDRFLPSARGPEDWAVDLGCGSGLFCDLLTRRGYRTVGIDLSLAMVCQTRQALSERVGAGRCAVAQADVCHAPLPDGCAALVLSSAVIEYVPDDRAALAEIARLTRPDGHAIIAVPNRQSLLRRAETVLYRNLERFRSRRPSDRDGLGRYQFRRFQHHQYRRADLLRLLEANGLRVERDRYCVAPGLHWTGRLTDLRWTGMMWVLLCRRTGPAVSAKPGSTNRPE